MIVTKENAEKELIRALGTMRSQPAAINKNLPCIVHVKLSELSEPREVLSQDQRVILLCVQNTIPDPSRVFLCEDGDTFILVPAVYSAEITQLISSIVSRVAKPGIEQRITPYELTRQMNTLLEQLETKFSHMPANEGKKAM